MGRDSEIVLVFDLDDTLYPEIEFVRSGFWSVATSLDPRQPWDVYRLLLDTFDRSGSGKVFDMLSAETGRVIDIPELVSFYRLHTPRISLAATTRIVLEHAKNNHHTALITDGPAQMQRNKFEALGLAAWIDFPVFTDELGTSKPDSKPFEAVMQHFCSARNFVYVADNPSKDFQAPGQLGWRTIRVRRADGIYQHLTNTAETEITSLGEMFDVLPQLERHHSHSAIGET